MSNEKPRDLMGGEAPTLCAPGVAAAQAAGELLPERLLTQKALERRLDLLLARIREMTDLIDDEDINAEMNDLAETADNLREVLWHDFPLPAPTISIPVPERRDAGKILPRPGTLNRHLYDLLLEARGLVDAINDPDVDAQLLREFADSADMVRRLL